MTSRIRIEPEASAEIEETALWYEHQRTGLGSEFLEAVDLALSQITRWPQAGAPVPGVSVGLAVRRVPLRRFPYQVVYLDMTDTIRILACAHDRRKPRYWRSRVRQ